MDMWISPFELPYRVSSVGGHQTKGYKKNDGSRFVRIVGGGDGLTHGTRPKAATTAGRERIPSDTVSATMTALDQLCPLLKSRWHTHGNHIACAGQQ